MQSRNGTFVNGQRVTEAPLEHGDQIALGSSKMVFRFIDASPPVALARNLKTNEIVSAQKENGLLAIPSANTPLASVFEAANGGWLAEVEGDVIDVKDGSIIDVDGKSYMLHLPTVLDVTMDSSGDWIGVREIGLHFRVRRNEESVEVTVQIRNDFHVLNRRAHHYTLFQLARVRLEEQANAKRPPEEEGWVSMDDLCRMLGTDEGKINVEIFRIRQDFIGLSLQNGAGIVERKRGAKKLRVGTHRIRIEKMD